jgi:hypothetical protein
MISRMIVLFLMLVARLDIIAQVHAKSTHAQTSPEDYYIKSLKLKDDPAPVKKIQLKTDSVQFKPANYFILSVEDSTHSNDSIGFVLQPKSGNKQKLMFENGTVAAFTKFAGKRVLRDSLLYPISIRVTQLDIEETRIRKVYDQTEIHYKYEFISQFKNKPLSVYSISGNGTFRTPLGQTKNYDSAIALGLANAWSQLDKGMEEITDKDPAFSKGVKKNIVLKTDDKNNPSDSIFYDGNYELQWDDFKGSSVQNEGIESYVGILVDPDIAYKDRFIQISIRVGTYFARNYSWAKGNAVQPKVLLHEQYRMHLVQSYTLGLKKKLADAPLTYENYAKLLQQLYHETIDAATAELKRYDDETKMGLAKKEQEKWQKKIEENLRVAENQ